MLALLGVVFTNVSMNQKLRITISHEARGKSKTVLKSGRELETESNWFQSVPDICTILLQSNIDRHFSFLAPVVVNNFQNYLKLISVDKNSDIFKPLLV